MGPVACSLPWADVTAARGVSATVGEIAAVGAIGQISASRDSVEQRAQAALGVLGEMAAFDAATLSRWDPVARTHRAVAGVDVPAELAGYSHSSRLLADDGYRYVRARRVAHRRCDVPRAERCDMVVRVLDPGGFAEGVTACLFRGDRYVGVLQLARRDDEPVSERGMLLLAISEPALARLVDVSQSIREALTAFDPSMATVVCAADGGVQPIPGRPASDLLHAGAPLLAEARRRAPRASGTHCFLWRSGGELWRVLVLRLTGGRELLVGVERATTTLSVRELQVLAAVAEGKQNPAIGSALSISHHTVARHVEHILDKLGVSNRVQAAACAVREGLILASAE